MKTSKWLIIAAVGAAAYLFLKKKSTTSLETVSYGTDATPQENASSTGYLRTTVANQSTATGTIPAATITKTSTFKNATEGVKQLNAALAAGEKIDSGSRTIRKFSADTSVAVKLPSGKTETYSGGTITQLAGQSKPVYIGVKPKTIRK